MATSLGIIEDRDVVQCDACGLVQFVTATRSCRRCRTPYERAAVAQVSEPRPAPAAAAIDPMDDPSSLFDWGSAIRLLRLAKGLTQEDLAARLTVPRTYISKIEMRVSVPTFSNFLRLAEGLEVAPWILVEFASVRQRLYGLQTDRSACSPAHARLTETTFAEAIL